MTTANRAQFYKELQEGLNTVFGLEYKQYPEHWRDIFDVANSSKAYEEDVLGTGFGAAVVKPEGESVQYDSFSDGWVARYDHETIALAFQITEELEEDGLYGSIGARGSKALARSMQHTKEVKGADVLNNGFSASFTGGDGQPLFSLNHPLQGGGVLANRLTVASDLSEAALEEAFNVMTEWTDDRGINIAVGAKRLIIPAELRFVAARILKSAYRPGTGDNDVNAIKALGMISDTPSVNPRLTDPDAWFVKTDAPDGMRHFVRKKIARGMEGDFNTGNVRYKARERYSFGWSDWRGMFASEGG